MIQRATTLWARIVVSLILCVVFVSVSKPCEDLGKVIIVAHHGDGSRGHTAGTASRAMGCLCQCHLAVKWTSSLTSGGGQSQCQFEFAAQSDPIPSGAITEIDHPPIIS